MAIVLGYKDIYQLENIPKIGIGISLPLQKGETGYFAQTFNTRDSIKSNLKNLLSTRQGERLMQPTFGTNLYNLLFENDTDDTPISQRIESSIESAVSYWLPFISIEEIQVNADNTSNRDKYIYNVSVSFTIDKFPDLENITFKISN